jgi:hypothetical protein
VGYLGVQGAAPKTYPRNVWLRDFMASAFGEERKFKSFSEQLDAFVTHMGWPARSIAEKTNQLENYASDPFLKGLQAMCELIYYGIPTDTVRILTLVLFRFGSSAPAYMQRNFFITQMTRLCS